MYKRQPLDFITDEAVDIAETVVNAVMVDRLKAALPLLSDSEQAVSYTHLDVYKRQGISRPERRIDEKS